MKWEWCKKMISLWKSNEQWQNFLKKYQNNLWHYVGYIMWCVPFLVHIQELGC
jgi:hypothetical protein